MRVYFDIGKVNETLYDGMQALYIKIEAMLLKSLRLFFGFCKVWYLELGIRWSRPVPGGDGYACVGSYPRRYISKRYPCSSEIWIFRLVEPGEHRALSRVYIYLTHDSAN